MALSENINTLEKAKFREAPNDKSKVAVVVEQDVLGKTKHYNGTIGLASALVPAVSGDKISQVIVKNSNSNAFSRVIYVAVDGGTDYFTLQKGESLIWHPKNNASSTPITQIRILGDAASVAYEIIMDFEP